MHALLLAILCALPISTFDEASECDLIVLNHTVSGGRSYSQLVVIDEGRIVSVTWQPAFLLGCRTHWVTRSQVYDKHVVTVSDYYGISTTWVADRYGEIRTENNDWMNQFGGDD